MGLQKIAIFGATSAIAMETARVLAARGADLFLVARDDKKLEALSADLKARGAKSVSHAQADLAEVSAHEALFTKAQQALVGLDAILIAHGTLPNQKECEVDFSLAQKEIGINFLSPLSLVHIAARIFEAQKSGTICVISSVAGDRGRQSNYIYGSAKGALSLALQGVRNRLFASGVKVVTIKPGFVDTPMTRDFKKGLLFVGPDRIARGILRAMDKGTEVVYLPWFWCGIMTIIKCIPEPIFKRLKL